MGNLSAQDLVKQLRQSLSCERAALADFLVALAELDHRRLFVELGYGSSWDFCRRALALSETATHYRLAAARQIQKQPELADEIRGGRLCITTLAKLSPVLTDQNRAALVAEAAGKPTRQVEQIVARLAPKPVPGDVVRRTDVPVSTQAQTQVLTETLLRKHLTVDADFEALLAQARDALSHSMPAASEVEILKEGLRRIVRDAARRKGLTKKPRTKPPCPPAQSADIPRAVMREVWQRDQGRCQWPNADGGICGSTRRVEFHHVVDRARGGLATRRQAAFDRFLLLSEFGLRQPRPAENAERLAKLGTGRAPPKLGGQVVEQKNAGDERARIAGMVSILVGHLRQQLKQLACRLQRFVVSSAPRERRRATEECGWPLEPLITAPQISQLFQERRHCPHRNHCIRMDATCDWAGASMSA